MNVRSCKMSESDNSRSESWVQHSETVWHPSREVTLMIASQVAKVVKNLPTNAGDTRNKGSIPGSGRSPGRRRWQHTLVFLAWRIPWTEEPGRLRPMGSQRVRHNWACTHTHTHLWSGIVTVLITRHPRLFWDLDDSYIKKNFFFSKMLNVGPYLG